MRAIDADELKTHKVYSLERHEYVVPVAFIDWQPTIPSQPETTKLLRKYSRPGVYADLWLHCEKCEGRIDDRWQYKYCPECGLKVVHQDG